VVDEYNKKRLINKKTILIALIHRIMNTKFYLLLILTGTFFLFSACSSNYDAPGIKTFSYNFDETEITIDFEHHEVVFTGDRTDCFLTFVRVIIDADTILYGYSYGEAKDEIAGDWYQINVDKNIVKVTVFENQSDKTRELILNMVAGEAGETLKIIQDKK
jgi:hypothetical protein